MNKMKRIYDIICISALAGVSVGARAAILTPEIENDFARRLPVVEKAGGVSIPSLRLNKDQEECMKMLYAYMPLPDMTDRTARYYIDYVVDPALKAREEMPWGKTVSDDLFRHFVLPVRVNNEALDRHRPVFYAELHDRVKDLSMKDAILEVNHWCHEKVTYQPSDGRTHSPLQSVGSAIGRCGEESTFTVAALRSVGIPARQVYTPRWAHTDDNHAWVEAWADGEWYFLGACEPEPVLNLGWFNAPASRGMLMHARVFGDYSGAEERLERVDGITFINVTENYAPVDTLSVRAVYPDGRPASGANASFRLYNYAEFYPIAEKITGSDGETSLVAGLGDLLVWVSDGERFGFAKGSVGKDRSVEVVLDHVAATPISIDIDVTPPAGSNPQTPVSDAMRRANDLRMAREDSIRNSYMATFCGADASRRVADVLGVDKERLASVMKKARSNHPVITLFLRGLPADERTKGLLLLESLTEKDLTDVTVEVLRDHVRTPDLGYGALFGEYVMSPRIYAEELTPFRSFFAEVVPEGQASSFRNDPESWVRWVRDNVDTSLAWYPEQITMSPEAVWNYRTTSPLSRDVFFVAGARSFGIPARIDPVTGKTQWADAGGKWIDASFSSSADATSRSAQGVLTLSYSPSSVVTDPKYYSHFTVSAIDGGEPSLLNYPDFIELSETFGKGESLDAGTYLVTSGQRMADGGVLAHLESVCIDGGSVEKPLALRHDEGRVQVIGSFDSESLFLPKDADKKTSLLSATGRGYYVLALLKAGHEPSNHVLRDLAGVAASLDEIGRPVVILTEDDRFDIDLSEFPALPRCVVLGADTDASLLDGVVEGVNLGGKDLPVIIVADTFNRVVFVSQGYTIGIGEKIASILRTLQQ